MFRVKEIWSTTGCTEERRVIGGFHWLGRKKNRTNRNTNKKKKQKLQYVACKKYRAQLGGWRRGGRLEDGRGLSAGGCSWWVGGWVLRSGDGKQTGGGSRSSEIMWAPKTREDQLQCKKCTKVGAVGERVGTEKLSR